MNNWLSKRVGPIKSIGVGFIITAITVWASPVAAAGGSGIPRGLTDILLLLFFIGVAYAIAHLLLERIAEKFGIVTGIEYIALGALVVPGIGLVETATIDKLTAAMVLGTGSLGLLSGLYIDIPKIRRRYRAFQVAFIISVCTAVTAIGVPSFLIWLIAPSQLVELLPGVMCFASVALVAAPAPIQSQIAYLGVSGEETAKTISTARFTSSFGIILFGLIFCFFKPANIQHTESLVFWLNWPTAVVWVPWLVVHLLLGGLLGFVFSGFLGSDFEEEQLLTVVIGLVIFTSGIAFYLNLSPIFVNFILGVVLTNTSEQDEKVTAMLQSIERPLYIILFFFSGTRLTFFDSKHMLVISVVVVSCYVVLRRLGRFFGGISSAYLVPKPPYNLGIDRALLASGALSVAMLLDFDEYHRQMEIDLGEFGLAGVYNVEPPLYAGLLVAVVISEVLSYRYIRQWLIDSSDVPAEETESGLKFEDVTEQME